MAKFYAVRKGRTPGIYINWEDCKKNTEGYPAAEFKSFKTAQEAAEYLGYAEKSKSTAGKSVSEKKAEDRKREEIKSHSADNSAYGFEDMVKDSLVAYVDGSYNIATKEYGYGAVLISGEGEIYLSDKGTDEELAAMRNVAGEIKGAEAAMRYALENGYRDITIYHDYEGIAKWCQGLWKTNKEGTKEYKRIYDEISTHLHIEFVKVKGHSGDIYNDMADELAKKAAGIN